MQIYREATSDSDEEGRAIISSDTSDSSDFNDDGSDAELVEEPPADNSTTRRRVNRASCRPNGE